MWKNKKHTARAVVLVYNIFSYLRVVRDNDDDNNVWYDSAQHRWSAHAYDLRTYAVQPPVDVSDPPATV